jgi:BirA family transcriptional regulator, biotin operon repressor / biotin---[acetyl-CoA-carboxylase] ligase
VQSRAEDRPASQMYDVIDSHNQETSIAIALRHHLPASERWTIRFTSEIDSTNAWARRELFNVSVPAVFITDHQTAGRGRMGRSWADQPGSNILLSIVLPSLLESDRSLTPLLSALAVAFAIEDTFPEVLPSLKWPNDVLIGGRKVAGILAEQTSHRSEAVTIIGIGINVNQATFPKGLRRPATSIKLATGKDIDRQKLLGAVVNRVRAVMDRSADPAPMLDEYRSRVMGHGERTSITIRPDDSPVEGVFVGIEDDGAMCLATPGGIERFHAGELQAEGDSAQ